MAPERPGRATIRTLARSITFQLLATKAANTIHQRVIDLCGGDVTPESITKAGHVKTARRGTLERQGRRNVGPRRTGARRSHSTSLSTVE